MMLLGGGIGLLFGVGLVLIASPRLAPRNTTSPRTRDEGSLVADRLVAAGFGSIRPGMFLLVSGLLGIACGAIVLAVTSLAAVGAIALVAGAAAPWTVAGWRAHSRSKAHRVLWPEVVDHLVAAIRAGQPLPDAIVELSRSGPVPFRPGFQVFERRWHETGTVSVALDATKEHFADPTADRLIELIRMAREVGGTELPSVLRDLAGALRQDQALRAEAEARQSWVTSAAKLGVAAPWAVLALLATRPEAAQAYNSPAGFALIVGALVACVAAYRIMLALGRLPEDRRWFR